MKYIDLVQIHVKAGDGGNGCVSFRREKFVPRGGPNGGDGGKGGDVIFQATDAMATLFDLKRKPQQTAQRGSHGMGKLRNGKDGEDLLIKVPIGTIIREQSSRKVMADLVHHDQKRIVARGGIGGKGNSHFKSSTFQTPMVSENGEPGEELTVELEVKMIADVGLVGFPNAGKSTLLAHASSAKPKIADYPFTTLRPNLGVVRIGTDQNFILADIPGLIEGASQGAGLGHDFLRHIERTNVIIHVVDIAGVDGRNPIDDFNQINRELELHNPRLTKIPQLVALNKIDLCQNDKSFQFEGKFGKRKVYEISALTGNGINRLMHSTYRLLQRINEKIRDDRKANIKPVKIETSRAKARFSIDRKLDGLFVVTGDEPKRAVLMTQMENQQAIILLHRKLKRMGLVRALEKAGICEGDRVKIDEFEFIFNADAS